MRKQLLRWLKTCVPPPAHLWCNKFSFWNRKRPKQLPRDQGNKNVLRTKTPKLRPNLMKSKALINLLKKDSIRLVELLRWEIEITKMCLVLKKEKVHQSFLVDKNLVTKVWDSHLIWMLKLRIWALKANQSVEILSLIIQLRQKARCLLINHH